MSGMITLLSGAMHMPINWWIPVKLDKHFIDPGFVYLLELEFISPEEHGLLQTIWNDMRNQEYRDIYADWLEERRRPETAQKVRDGFVPGYGMANLKNGGSTVASGLLS